MGPNGDSPCLHTTTASVTTWLVEVRKSGFENIDNWKCAFTCFLSHLLRRFKWKKLPSLFVSKYKKGQNLKLLKHFLIRIFTMFERKMWIQTNVNLTSWPCIHIQSFPLLSKRETEMAINSELEVKLWQIPENSRETRLSLVTTECWPFTCMHFLVGGKWIEMPFFNIQTNI